MSSHELIAFSLFTYSGEFASWDLPHGVGQSECESGIYIVRADGTDLCKITGEHHRANNPRFAPDGSALYFQAVVDGHSHIFRCGLDGSNPQNLTASHTISKDSFGFDFAPDGRLVYVSNDGKIGRVATMNADGSSPALLAPKLGYCYMASFSPDGKRIVFAHTDRGYTLVAADADGEHLTALTPGVNECFAPRYAADGRTIVFIRRDEDIYSVAADGSDFRRLTRGNNYLHFYLSHNDKHGSTDGPFLSPDGKHIAYIAMKDGLSQVHVMNIDGSEQRQITRTATRNGRVRWSGDGSRLAFASFVREGRPQLFVVDAHSPGAPRQLTELDGAVYLFDWLPRK